jgi:microcystin-dependent protein
MGLETGTFVEDLVVTNPPGSDDKRQGDDHLRLIKSVLRNTLKRATKAFYLPTASVTKTAAFSVVSTDENTNFLIDTTAGFVDVSLPALAAANAGFRLTFTKINSGPSSIFLTPASGTINGVGRVPRSVSFVPFDVVWTGSTWAAARQFGVPTGSVVPCYATTLPNGCFWANGGSLVGVEAFYPELVAALGTTTIPDLRGRMVAGRDDMGGTLAGRITSGGSGIPGVTLGATGGTETHTLTLAQLAAHNHGVNDPTHSHGTTDGGHNHGDNISFVDTGHGHGVNDPGHSHGVSGGTQGGTVNGSVQPGGTSAPATSSTIVINSATTGITIQSGNANLSKSGGVSSNVSGVGINAAGTGISTQNNGSGAAHQNMPPTSICNYIIVAE